MMKIFVLALLATAVTAKPARIVGGEETTIEENPYQLELETSLLGLPIWQFSCGAVIVGEDAVLTAGHCVVDTKEANIRFRAGSTARGSGSIHKISSLVLHPNYTESLVPENDIAFIRVTPAFEFSATTQPINLTDSEPVEGQDATISGWGITDEDSDTAPTNLRRVTLPVISREVCNQKLQATHEITQDMICVGDLNGGKDSCSGDSGGPIVVDGALAGLVSWGYGCAEVDKPGVYTNVAYFNSWVKEQLSQA